MAANLYWCLCAISREQYQALIPYFEALKKQAIIPRKYRDVYQLANESPERLIPQKIPYEQMSEERKKQAIYQNGYIDNKFQLDFSSIFYIDGFSKIYQTIKLNEKNVLRFISVEGLTPISVLYHALTPQVAEKLPGFFGNLLLESKQIDTVLTQVNQVLKHIDEDTWDRARSYISPCGNPNLNRHHDQEIEKIFTALPDSLTEAKRRGQCIVSTANVDF